MQPRLQLDLTPSDLAFAARACVRSEARDVVRTRLERRFAGDEGFACLSVRSGFDLLLTALALPKGSEVVFSAITIPDMARIVAHHGLVAVPVDLDPSTLAPRLDELALAITPRTKLVVVAHLFGGRVDLDPILAITEEAGVPLVEDCAQAFVGPAFTGHPRALASMFSFGAIKTMTALGGALFRVRDADLLARMRAEESTWPEPATSWFPQRVAKYAALVAASEPHVYGAIAAMLNASGRTLDDVVSEATRGFPLPKTDGPDAAKQQAAALAEKIRRRPPAALLMLLERRLAQWDGKRLARRAAIGEALRDWLPPGVFLPGRDAHERTHWLFAVDVADADPVIAHLAARGFDATRKTSSIFAVPPPPDRPELTPHAARRVLRDLVFLPAHPGLDDRAVDALATALAEATAGAPTFVPDALAA